MNDFSRLVFEKRTLGIPGIHGLGQYNYTKARGSLPLHQHENCIEISFLVKGRQTYQIGKKAYYFKGGDQYVCYEDDIHGTGAEPEEKGILYWLILDVGQPREKFLFLDHEFAEQLIAALRDLPSRHFVSNPESRSTLEKAFQSLLQVRIPDECTGLFEQEIPVRAAPLDGGNLLAQQSDFSLHLLEAVGHITHYILQTINSSRANSHLVSPLIQRGLQFMEKNECEYLKVSEVAQAVHLPEPSFKLRFRKEIGLPPAEYMLRRKIEIAKRRLAHSNATITDVAHGLGFSTSQYFATVFRRYTHQTPSEFLKARNGTFEVIFDGDSITQNWLTDGRDVWRLRYSGLNVGNLAVGGDQVQHVISRVRNGSLDGQDPQLIVVMIGTNNIRQDPLRTAALIKTLLGEYKKHCPSAHILLHALFPRESSPTAESHAWVGKVNQVISTYGDDRVTYMDIGAEFVEQDGTISTDIMFMNPRCLHPTAKGYEIWARAIQPVINQRVVRKSVENEGEDL